MEKSLKKLGYGILIVILLWVVVFETPIGAWAFQYTQKSISGLGQDTFTGEVLITDTHASGNTRYVVWIQSTATTVAAKVYTVYLYFDDVVQGITQTVSWTAGEIPGTTKKVTLTGLSMATVNVVEVEIR